MSSFTRVRRTLMTALVRFAEERLRAELPVAPQLFHNPTRRTEPWLARGRAIHTQPPSGSSLPRAGAV